VKVHFRVGAVRLREPRAERQWHLSSAAPPRMAAPARFRGPPCRYVKPSPDLHPGAGACGRVRIGAARAQTFPRWRDARTGPSRGLPGDHAAHGRPHGALKAFGLDRRRIVRPADAAVGCEPPMPNVPMSLGIPSIVIRRRRARPAASTRSASGSTSPMQWKGAQNSLVTVLGLVGVQGVSQPLARESVRHGAASAVPRDGESRAG
jgi:hypothetical protein